MKKIHNVFCAALVVAIAASCVKEQPVPEEEIIPEGYEKVTFSVSTQDTKTTRPEDGEYAGKTVWSKGDQLNMLYSGGSATGTLQGDGGSTRGSFEAVLPVGVSPVYAVYPKALTSSLDEGSISVTIPSSQNGSFGQCNVAVAKADDDNNLPFNNVNALLKVGIPGSGVTRITVESVDGSALVGTINTTVSEDGITLGDCTDTGSSLEASLPGEAGVYYMSILPGVTHSKGLLLKYYKGEEESGKYLLDKSVTTKVNKSLSFGEFEPTNNYYVTVTGAGNKSGVSWANAMDVAAFKKLVFSSSSYSGTRDNDADILKYSTLNGATIHMGAGDYVVASASDDLPTIGFAASGVGEKFKLKIIGGYAAGGSATPDPAVNITAIKGNGGSNVGRIMVLEYRSYVTFEGITFTESHGTAGGQACVRVVHSEQHFNNCRFVGNTNTASGCAMHVGNAQAYLTDCVFSGNSSTSGAGINIDGNESTYVSLTDCSFSDNTASQYGGAIRLATGELEINGGSFTGNTATKQGGAIYVTSTGASAGINGATFTSNGECTDDKEGQGGAVWVGGGASAELVNCTFTSNTARVGGAIGCANDSSNTNTVSIDGCTFNGNSSTGVGGAIIMTSKGTLDVTNSTFTGNSSGGNGGVVRGDGANTTFTFDNVTFNGNYASGSGKGGVIVIDNGKYRFNKCCFNGNYSNQGGVIYAGSTNTIYLNDCLFTGNYITNTYGTSICANSTGVTLCMNNCTFADNTYSTSATSSIQACWINVKAKKFVLCNSTLIGYSRRGANGSTNSGGAALTRWQEGDGTVSYINNIVAHIHGDAALIKNAGTVTMTAVSNKTSGYSSITPTTSGTDGTGFKGTSSYFGGLSYVSNANPAWNNCYWNWNGTLATGSNLLMDSSANIISAITTADSNFAAWLNEVDGLFYDGQGNFRGNGTWWPGAHQPAAEPVTGTPIRVMSFNTLFRGYDDKELGDGTIVKDSKPERTWANRAPGCYAMIAGLSPDIIGMQECEGSQKKNYVSNCTDYGVYGVSCTSGTETGAAEEVPMLYRKSTLSVVSKGTFWLSNTPSVPGSKHSEADLARPATWAVMKVKATNEKFFFINVHFSTSEVARTFEAGKLLEGINSRNTDNLPVILTGDQNCLDTDSCMDVFRNAGYYCTRRIAPGADTGVTFPAFGYQSGIMDNIWIKGCSAANDFVVDRQTWAGVKYISDHYPVYSTIVL